MSGYLGEVGFRALSEVEAYWEGLRRGRCVPARSDIDPRGIENALEYAFILEKIAPGLARIRIAGTHLSDVMGMEVRGMPISAFVPPSGRKSFADTLEQVTTTPAVARLTMTAETAIGKPPLEARMLLLPLESDFGDISRVLGCFGTKGQIGRAPRRFDVVQTDLRALHGAGPAARTGKPAARNPRAAVVESAGFKEAQTAFRHRRDSTGKTTSRPRRPSYLKLVKPDE